MSEVTQNTMCFAVVGKFSADRAEFVEWLNTYGHRDAYDVEFNIQIQDDLA